MVGFGSSLRMSRRRGWENAYLDYESLKLLLTHIEAVYEETRHDNISRTHSGQHSHGGMSGFGGFGAMIGGGGGDHDDPNATSALGHVNFHFMENEDDVDHPPHQREVPGLDVGRSRHDSNERSGGGGGGGGRQSQQQQKQDKKAPMDYRDELFLESDSDFAYLSVGDDHESDEDDGTSNSIGHQMEDDMGISSNNVHHDNGDTYEYDNEELEGRDVTLPENRSYGYGSTQDGPMPELQEQQQLLPRGDIWQSEQIEEQEQQENPQAHFGGGTDAYAIDANPDVEEEDDGKFDADDEEDDYLAGMAARHNQYVYEPLSQVGNKSESSQLLLSSRRGEESKSSFFSMFNRRKKEEEKQPKQEDHYHRQTQTGSLTNFGRNVSVGPVGVVQATDERLLMINQPRGPDPVSSGGNKKPVKKVDVMKLKQRVKKRKTKKRRKRRRRTKAPIHILIAHSKARAITERFLGLLRAEVEKITLFAHARMGELADTIGSLRFPSYEDGTVGNANSYPLSDGGIHPSASSSSDEFGRSFSWSDYSSGDEMAGDHLKISMKQKIGSPNSRRETRLQGRSSATSAAVVAAGKRDRSPRRIGATPVSRRILPYQAIARNNQNGLAMKQIQQAEQLRIDRPTFQRAEHVLDDDFLLLSAVDEADAFAAVGVELMHLLRYICVNVIAVRKICKKHDRLLANRMLGGYYHRLRQQRRNTELTFKRLGLRKRRNGRSRQTQQGISGWDGGVSSSQAPLLGRMFASSMGNELEGNLDKLVGVLDTKIQQLANSTTVEMISSVLAFALAEYEISQNRADALSKVNTTSALRQGGSSGANSVASQDGDEIDGLCWGGSIPRPTSFGLPASPRKIPAISSVRALDEQKSPLSFSSTGSFEHQSDSSNMSLTRLKFVVASVYGLREAARPKSSHFRGFLSRAAMTFTGPNVVGDGLDGCSRETLEFLLSYDPDSALIVPCHTLYRSLQRGKSKGTVCGVMTASLAAADSGDHGSDYTVQNALTIMPVPSNYEYLESGLSSTLKGWKATVAEGDVIVQRGTVRLNRFSLFLYTMNYYIVSPTARAHSLLLGENMAHSATLIGIASVSSLLGALLHSYLLSKDDTASKLPSDGPFFFRIPLMLSAMSALAGNVIYADAPRHKSLLMAYIGRFLVGFGSAEVLNTNLISKCIPPAGLVSESAKLVKASMLGILVGPLIGTFLAIGETEIVVPSSFGAFGQGGSSIGDYEQKTLMSPRSVSAPGYFMAGLWFLQICGLLCFFQEPKKKSKKKLSSRNSDVALDEAKGRDSPNDGRFVPEELDFPSDSSSVSHHDAAASDKRNLLYRTLSDATPEDIEAAYGTITGTSGPVTGKNDTSRSNSKNFAASDDEYASPDVIAEKRPRRRRPIRSTLNRARKLIFHNVALPATIAILAFATFSQETLFSSCAIVTHRYFGWNSALSGLWLTTLGALVLPVNFIIESISRYREERIAMKCGLMTIGLGLVIIINYEALLVLILHLRDMFREAQGVEDRPNMYYDWSLGVIQYTIGTLIIMSSIVSIEGCTLSLMSKVAPSRLESSTLNLGLIVSIIRPSTRFLADVFILLVGLSHRIINTDVINSLSLVLIISCLAVYFVVKRHYFFLYG